jgi:hypothetical protein
MASIGEFPSIYVILISGLFYNVLNISGYIASDYNTLLLVNN